MSEKDAAGRDPSEDPLAAMGWDEGGCATSAPPAQPAQAAPDAAEAEPAPARTIAPRNAEPAPSATMRRADIVRAAVTLVSVAAVGVALFAALVPWASNLADTPGPSPAAEEGGSLAGSGDASVAAPRGLAAGSLLRPENLAPAVRRLRTRLGGHPRFVRVSADRVDAQVILAGDRIRLGSFTWDGVTRVIATTKAAGVSGVPVLRWSQVDPRAPLRLVRSATAQARAPATGFDYAVLARAGRVQWTAFLRGGSAWTAGADGHRAQPLPG